MYVVFSGGNKVNDISKEPGPIDPSPKWRPKIQIGQY